MTLSGFVTLLPVRVAGLLLACLVLSHLIVRALVRAGGHAPFLLRLLLLPGVTLHELSHAAACLLTFTRIHEISVWDRGGGGHVTSERPRLPLLTQPIISLAPLPVGVAALLLLSRGLPAHAVAWADGSHWLRTAAVLLLMLSVAATLAPSKPDALLALQGLLAATVAGSLLYALRPSLLDGFTPALARLAGPLMLVDGLLLALWLGLTMLNAGRRL